MKNLLTFLIVFFIATTLFDQPKEERIDFDHLK